MDFDQKAVKFLASFYINGGKHWTDGPLRQTPEPSQLRAAVLLLGLGLAEAWAGMRPPGEQTALGRQGRAGTSLRPCFPRSVLERRPPLTVDLDIPGPTKYEVPSASVRESSPHPHYSFGRRYPGRAQTPGPAAYSVEDCYNSRFPSAPTVVIQGVRRPKRHDTGPFCTL
ncbi:hypothetical protein TREES_T100011185 [Tupaia chinensis]|uniref:Protein STPG3 n=1 Tax=Tupaia chinensis TaxID=246437 RepID=L8YFD2_TUPCH|nr:hypothetical protein TREES_T100011185 [Tupaia chinensis]